MLGTSVQVLDSSKQALGAVMLEMGPTVAESIMLIEWEEVAGPDYYPTYPGLQKWAHEAGSAYIGDQEVLSVSSSDYYMWRNCAPSTRANEDAVLTQKIPHYQRQLRQTYGALLSMLIKMKRESLWPQTGAQANATGRPARR